MSFVHSKSCVRFPSCTVFNSILSLISLVLYIMKKEKFKERKLNLHDCWKMCSGLEAVIWVIQERSPKCKEAWKRMSWTEAHSIKTSITENLLESSSFQRFFIFYQKYIKKKISNRRTNIILFFFGSSIIQRTENANMNMDRTDTEMMEMETMPSDAGQGDVLRDFLALARQLLNQGKPSQALQAVIFNFIKFLFSPSSPSIFLRFDLYCP